MFSKIESMSLTSLIGNIQSSPMNPAFDTWAVSQIILRHILWEFLESNPVGDLERLDELRSIQDALPTLGEIENHFRSLAQIALLGQRIEVMKQKLLL